MSKFFEKYSIIPFPTSRITPPPPVDGFIGENAFEKSREREKYKDRRPGRRFLDRGLLNVIRIKRYPAGSGYL